MTGFDRPPGNRPTRRELLGLLGTGAATLALPGCASSPPLKSSRTASLMDAEAWGGLATSLLDEKSYAPRVEGALPKGLRGTLYRNGPGLFDRGGRRRRALLDGDGLVQMFRFGDSGVDYRARFVRTKKFVAEERAGAFVYGTFSTQAPGGLFANVLPNRKILSQAGITAVPWRGRVYAFDETGLPWELDEETLETIGETSFGLPRDQTLYAAHNKIDVETGEWLHFGLQYGRTASVHLTTFAPDGSLAGHDVHPLPRFSYLHDWFVTKRFVVLHLHPATIEVWGLLLGLRSIVDSLRWNGADGSLLMILPRDRPAGGVAPRFVETDASFMWHSFNGHEEGDDLVLDFIGYENPDHFIGPDPRALAVMQGRPGEFEHPGSVRRIRVEPGGKRARNEVVAAGNFEWPRIDDRLLGRRNRWGFMASARPKEFFWDAVARVDFENGGVETHGFGDRVFTSEPVFVPDPTREGASREEAGWLLVELYDGNERRSSLAVLDAGRITEGPVARVLLDHHVPISFHGYWRPRS
ncbi:MAG TPA: carotenoid oxygenase family protein [Thermoanaerobaculia bacterium]|nr:carotenoid oxygenase family protein [Thermoanaerobaculia bacterium]